MKKFIIFFIFWLAILPDKQAIAQTISSTFYSQNYWQPNRSPFTGQLGAAGSTWWSDVEASGVKYMRVGGLAYDAQNNQPAGTTYIWSSTDLASGSGSIIAEIRSHNSIEPIIQVPIDINKTIAQNVVACSTLVYDINVTYARSILYWEIGNEPNTSYAGANNYNTDAVIADYIKQVSTAMKGVSGSIKIIGPSFSFYDNTRYGEFLGGSIPCPTCDISGSGANGYYIDYIDFHTYPFQNECFWQHSDATVPCISGGTNVFRSDVVNYIEASFKFKANLGLLVNKVAAVNLSRATSPLKISITEANISYEQDRSNKLVTDIGPGSFLGGQFWAELMGASLEKGVELLSFWSVIEGYSGDSYLTDCGYIGSEATSKYRSTYWHFKMMANNFKGTYLPNLLGNSGNYKAFAYMNTTSPANEIGVIVMNQDLQSPRGTDITSKTLGISFDGGTSAETLKVQLNIASPPAITSYSCKITNETSMLLVFDRTSGALIRKEVYNLGDALRTIDTGPEVWGTPAANTLTITTQDQFNSYYDAIYSDLIITPASSIAEGSSDTKTFRFTNTATMGGASGDFTVPLGAEFTLLPLTTSCP